MDYFISDIISLIQEMPKGEFFPYKNGVIQTYSDLPLRGNLYLNEKPALNYYIYRPSELILYFGTDTPPRISYEPFIFNSIDSICHISKSADNYPIAKCIVTYFSELLDAHNKEV